MKAPGVAPGPELEAQGSGAAGTVLDVRLVPGAALSWALAWWITTGPGLTWPVLLLGVSGLIVGVVGAALGEQWRVPERWRVPARGWLAGSSGRQVLLLTVLAVIPVALQSGAAVSARQNSPVAEWVRQRATATLVGRLWQDPVQLPPGRFESGPRWSMSVSRPAVAARGQVAQAAGPVTVLGPRCAAVAGARIRVQGRLGPTRFGSAVGELTAQGDCAVEPPPRVWALADRARAGLRESSAGHGQASALLPALGVGDTSGLSQGTKELLRGTGLTHLTAVSGANLTIAVGALVGVATWCGAGRRLRILLGVLAIAAFVILARPSPSVVRAAAMGTVGLLALLRSGTAPSLNVLSLAVWGLLVADPWLAGSISMALSAAATFGLVALAPFLVQRWSPWLGRPVAMALAVPAAATVATLPLVAQLSPALSTAVIAVNVLVAPLVVVATISALVTALLASLGSLTAFGGLTGLAGLGALSAVPGLLACQGILLSARAAERFPMVPVPAGLAALLLALALAALLLGWPRRLSALLALAATGLLLGALLAGALGRGRVSPSWVAMQCDVGQGDALVVRTGPDRALLIDTGPDPGLIRPCLAGLGVKHLDLVVITHLHADHVGGLPGVLAWGTVPALLRTPADLPASVSAQLDDQLAQAAVPTYRVAHGQTLTAGSAQITVLWPRPDARGPGALAGGGGHEDASGEEINSTSVVTLIRVNGLSLLDLGDLETQAQTTLLAQHPEWPQIDILKVAHHGSAHQNPELYRRVQPRVALIGVGRDNGYGHPAPSTLALLREVGAATIRTDTDGRAGVCQENGVLRLCR